MLSRDEPQMMRCCPDLLKIIEFRIIRSSSTDSKRTDDQTEELRLYQCRVGYPQQFEECPPSVSRRYHGHFKF